MKRLAAAVLLLLSTAAQGQETSYRRGVAERLAGDAEAAVATLREAVAAEPANADAHLQLGLALLQAGRLDEAETSLRKVLEIAPDYDDARVALARIAQRRGDAAAARTALSPIASGNAEADALRRQLTRGSTAGRTRVDLDGSRSELEGGRPDWKELALRLRRQITERTAVAAGSEYLRRFGRTDLYLEGRIEHRVSDAFSGYLALGGTPDADFAPQWQIGVGGAARILGGTNPTVITLDTRAAEYPAGAIYTVNPGIEQYLAGGRVWLTGRSINLFDENGNHVSGWLARGDLLATERLRLFAGASDAPDVSEGVVTDLFSVFGGLAYDYTDRTVFRLSLAHEDSPAGGDRLQAGFGIGFRF